MYNGSNKVFTVGELTSLTNETAYPTLEMNHPPGGAINYTTNPPSKLLTSLHERNNVIDDFQLRSTTRIT